MDPATGAPIESPTSPGMTLPPLPESEKITLEWTDLCYDVALSRGKGNKRILDNISGFAKPGTVTALLGASGSGKTSLLMLLAQRLEGSAKRASVTGSLKINGRELKEHHEFGQYRENAAMIYQYPALFPFATAQETLEFYARLKLPHLSEAQRAKRIDEMIAALGLVRCRDTRVGDGNRVLGLSGGERKRLDIILNTLAGSPLVFADEPTSGLDAASTVQCMTSFKALADSGRTCLLSIHQPRSSVFDMVDSVILMSEGRLVYFGGAKAMIEHFSRLNYKCPSHFNPADYVIDILAIAGTSTDEFDKAEARVRALQKESHALCNFSADLDATSTAQQKERKMATTIQSPILLQTKLLFQRQWAEVSRNRAAAIFKVLNGILISLIVIFLFQGLDDSQEAIQDRVGLLFFLVINQLFGPLFGTVAVFSKELGIVNRERGAHLYRMTPYYLAKTISGLPFDALPVIAAMSIIYWALDLNHSLENYVIFFACGLLMNLCSIGLGHGISALSRGNAEGAQAGVAPIAMFMLFCSGFYINTKNLPGAVAWMPDVSYMGNAYATLVINEFSDLELKCTEQDVATGNCVPNGDLVIDRLGFDDRSTAVNFLALGLNVLALNLVALFFLTRSGPSYLVLNTSVYSPEVVKVKGATEGAASSETTPNTTKA